MNIDIEPDRGELRVTVIENGTDISYTTITGKTRFEVISKNTVMHIEMGAETEFDSHRSCDQLDLPF